MSRRWFLILLGVATAGFLGIILGFRPAPSPSTPQSTTITRTAENQTAMILMSEAFKDGEHIPRKYTCDGENVSPPLSWSQAPEKTASYALIMDDPDSPSVFTHWVIFNIPATQNSLQEKTPEKEILPNGIIQGKNDAGETGYVGPCPPSATHRYEFRLYALDTELDLPPSITKQDVLRAVEGHILGETKLTGLYSRS